MESLCWGLRDHDTTSSAISSETYPSLEPLESLELFNYSIILIFFTFFRTTCLCYSLTISRVILFRRSWWFICSTGFTLNSFFKLVLRIEGLLDMFTLNFSTLSRPILTIEFLADISLLFLLLSLFYLTTSTFFNGIFCNYLDTTISFGLSWLSSARHLSWSWLYMWGNITFFIMFDYLDSFPINPVALLYYKNSSVYCLYFYICL